MVSELPCTVGGVAIRSRLINPNSLRSPLMQQHRPPQYTVRRVRHCVFQASQRLARTLSYDTVLCFRLFIIPFIYELYSKLCVYRRAAKTVSPNRMCKQICRMHFPLFYIPVLLHL